ncbi:tail-completion protein [Vibrio phage 3.058.O._10N.286.46.B8]|nr:tail-completion protein [Vibrio phage 2.058.O._10N.286.46.B8]AUS03080.1 tail-completion protein [Vibrio phage 3.058.O._10N.286.46.B8]
MIEIDLKNDLESSMGMNAYPIKIPQNAAYPAIVYKEISNGRNDDSNLDSSNLRNKYYEIVIVTPDSELVITKKNELIEKYEGFSGTMGETNIFISRIESSVPSFDNAQQNFEYNITIKFTENI